MSKFTKRKNKKITNYEKCPPLSLMYIANFVNSFHYVGNDIKEAYLVDDTNSKIVFQNTSVYFTTQYLRDLVQNLYNINLSQDEYGATIRKSFDLQKGTESERRRFKSYSHYHYSSNTYKCTLPLMILDVLFYMKELGKTSIKASMEGDISDANRGSGMKVVHMPNTNSKKYKSMIDCPSFISERLEFTRIKNEFMMMYKGNTKRINDIRKINSVSQLFNFAGRQYNDDHKLQKCKITNLYYEVGGNV